MVARGAGAAGPVLLACRQWDPLGLARRLPSLGVGAWRSAPLLPSRVQCPVCVCAALGRFGGLGPVPGVVSLPFPPPRPACPALRVAGRPVRVSLTLARWYAIPRGLCDPRARSGHPSGSPCVPFACVRSRSRGVRSPPPLGGVACAPRAAPALGTGRAVGGGPCLSACPAPIPCSIWRALGGGGPVPVPTYLALGCAPPVGRVGGVPVPEGRFRGGGGGPCALPPVCAAGGASRARGRSASFRPSAFPGQATKRVSLASFLSWGAWSLYASGPCSPAFSGRDLCGVLARWRGVACSPRFLWEPAAGAGGRAVLRLLSRAGGGGTIPPASGGGGRHPRSLRAGGGAGGGGRAAASLLPLWGAPRGSLPWPPSCRRRTAPRRARSVRVAGPPRGGGGMRGGLWTAPLGAPSGLNPPSALPECAMVLGGVMGGAASILFWWAAVRRPKAWSARRSGALAWARPSAATPAGAGG